MKLKIGLIFGLFFTLNNNTSVASNLDAYNSELLKEINIYRQKNNLKALKVDDNLNQLAKEHSAYMVAHKNLSHDNFNQRFKMSGRMMCNENVGWNYKTGKAMFEGWRTSSGHNTNMLNREITIVGLSKVGDYITFFACK